MQPKRVSPLNGLSWLTGGLRLWLRKPLALSFASIGLILTPMTLFVVLPYHSLGLKIGLLISPSLSLGIMNLCRAIDEGKPMVPNLLLFGFRHNLKQIFLYGLCYLLVIEATAILFDLVDNNRLATILQSITREQRPPEFPELLPSILLLLLFQLPAQMMNWFAPVLCGWWQMTAPKAMFFSFFGCLRNWPAFVCYVLTLLTALMALGISLTLLNFISLPFYQVSVGLLPFALFPILFASFYVSVRDVLTLPTHAS